MRVGLWITLAACVAAVPQRASAQALGADIEAASRANDVVEEYCAVLVTGKTAAAASGTRAVAEAWEQVSTAYDQTQALYLLFWRGTLAQCLNREEQAKEDLQAFLASPGSMGFGDLRRRSERSLKRLGLKIRIGNGPSAKWVRRIHAIDLGLRLGGGGGVGVLSCTDPDEVDGVPRVENGACLGGRLPYSPTAALVQPLLVELDVEANPHRNIGVGARVGFDLPAPGAPPDGRSPAPTLELDIGPRLRVVHVLNPGKPDPAANFYVEPRVAVGISGLSPWAGNAKYPDRFGYLDAGTLGLFLVGGSLRIGGHGELDLHNSLEVEGRFTAQAGLATWTLRADAAAPIRDAGFDTPADESDDHSHDEYVDEFPGVVSSRRFSAGFHVAILRAVEDRALSVGPFLDLSWQQSFVEFPNDADDLWSRPAGSTADGDQRKVYSTQRDDVFARLGIELRFGQGAPPERVEK